VTDTHRNLEQLGAMLDDVSGSWSQIKGQQSLLKKSLIADREKLSETECYLDVSERVTTALEKLNEEIFRQEIELVEDSLTKALQDVLVQPIALKAEVSWKNNAASVSFEVERDGNPEHIMRGQGGSVANILSVGLRIFALRNLGDDHRSLLVLDEQDCWLRPDRVPELVHLIRQAAVKLGIQMIVISHHDEQLFEIHADRMFEFTPQRGGSVRVEQLKMAATDADHEL
jgi:ABC-type glutathione transport system ATPase component